MKRTFILITLAATVFTYSSAMTMFEVYQHYCNHHNYTEDFATFETAWAEAGLDEGQCIPCECWEEK